MVRWVMTFASAAVHKGNVQDLDSDPDQSDPTNINVESNGALRTNRCSDLGWTLVGTAKILSLG